MTDYNAIKIWVDVAQFLITGVIGAYLYFSNQNQATRGQIKTLEEGVDERLDDQARKLAALERDIIHAPSDDDIKRIHARIDEVGGSIKRLEGEFSGANHMLHTIHQFLLNGGGK